MANSLTNDSQGRAKLILNASGGVGTLTYSATVTDGNPTFGGYGASGATLRVWVNGSLVVNETNKSYDFGGSTGSNTIIANAFFPRAGKTFEATIPYAAGYWEVTATFSTTGNVGSATVTEYASVSSPPPFFPPYFPFFPFFPFFPSFTPAPVWASETPPSSVDATELESKSISLSASNTTSYSITSGTLPTGLTLNSSAATISGTPSRNSRGTYNVVITATGVGGSATKNLKIVVLGAKGVTQIYDTSTSQWKEGVVHVYNSDTSTWVEGLVYVYNSSTSSWVISQSTYTP